MTFMLLPETGVSENLTWKTEILKSRNGREYRQSLIEEPRVQLSASFTLGEDERFAFEPIVDTRIQTVSVVPIWQYTSRISAPTSSGGSRIYFDKSVMSLNDGQYICIINLATKAFYSFTIFNIETDGVTLNETLTVDIDRTFIVMPGMLATIGAASFNWDMVRGGANLTFDSFEDNILLEEGNSITLDTVLSVPVITETFFRGIEDTKDFTFQVLDNETGKREYRTREDFVRNTGKRIFTFERYRQPEKAQWWRKFLSTVKGAWKPIWVASQLNDLNAANNSLAGDNFLFIEEDLVFGPTPIYAQIYYCDGSVSQHLVSEFAITRPVTVGVAFEVDYDRFDMWSLWRFMRESIEDDKVTASFSVFIDWFYPEPTGNNDNNFHSLDINTMTTTLPDNIYQNGSFASFNDTAGGTVTLLMDPLSRYIEVRSKNQSTYSPIDPAQSTVLDSTLSFIFSPDTWVFNGIAYRPVSLSPALPNNAKVECIARVSYLSRYRLGDTVRLTHDHRQTTVEIEITEIESIT